MVAETITESEIWADLDKIYAIPERELGDIDTKQLVKRYGISDTEAKRRMERLALSGAWERIKVRDKGVYRGWIYVIRKKK